MRVDRFHCRLRRNALGILVASLLLLPTVTAQDAAPPGTAAPDHVVYRTMFRHYQHVQERADAVQAEGGDPTPYREYYKRQIGLTDAEDQSLGSIIEACNEAVRRLDVQAQAIIADVRSRYPGGRLEPGQELPPTPPELISLQAQRVAEINAAIAKLSAALGPARFDAVEAFVAEKFRPNVSWTPTSPPDGQ